MNRGILTAAGVLIASHALVSLISHHGIETDKPSFYPAPFDTVLTLPVEEPAIGEIPPADMAGADNHVNSEPAPDESGAPALETTDEAVAAGEPVAVQPPADITVDSEVTVIIEDETVEESVTSSSEPAAPPISVLDDAPVIAVPKPTLSAEDSLLLLIPERAWPDSHRVRGALTPEVALEHPAGQYIPRTVENGVWGVGEKLVFSIDYGFLNAGTATMSVLGTEEVNGAESYHIQTTARSNDFISSFYEVRDQVNSYIDKEGIFSRRIEKLLREGSYKSDRYVDFYPDRKIAISNEKKKPVTEIPLYVQDVLSSLYLIRTYDLKVGTDVFIETYADGKVYSLRVKVHKTEKIKVPAGTFTCWVVEPFLQSDGIFRQKGQLKVWLTMDEHKMPVKMTSKIVIGSIGTNLESYTLGVTD